MVSIRVAFRAEVAGASVLAPGVLATVSEVLSDPLPDLVDEGGEECG